MKNVEMTVDGNIMTIKVDLSKDFGVSKSGKTVIVASSNGGAKVPDHNDKTVNLTVYKKA